MSLSPHKNMPGGRYGDHFEVVEWAHDRLTQLAEIHEEGASASDIAERFNISKSRVYQLLKKHKAKHADKAS